MANFSVRISGRHMRHVDDLTSRLAEKGLPVDRNTVVRLAIEELHDRVEEGGAPSDELVERAKTRLIRKEI